MYILIDSKNAYLKLFYKMGALLYELVYKELYTYIDVIID